MNNVKKRKAFTIKESLLYEILKLLQVLEKRLVILIDAQNFTFVQSTPVTTWTVNHNLSKYPSVSVFDNNNILIEGCVEYVSIDQVVITFNQAIAGTATLS